MAAAATTVLSVGNDDARTVCAISLHEGLGHRALALPSPLASSSVEAFRCIGDMLGHRLAVLRLLTIDKIVGMTPKQWPARAASDQVLADSCIAFMPEADGFETEFRTRSRLPAAPYGRTPGCSRSQA